MILVSVVSGLSEVNSTFLSGNGVKDLGDGVADGIAGHEDLSMLWMRLTSATSTPSRPTNTFFSKL